MHNRILIKSIATTALLSLLACESTGTGGFTGMSTSSPSQQMTSSTVSGYGVVQAIEMAPRDTAGIGVGTAAGAIVGGILGNQIGQGSGNTAATIAGVAGGAYLGHEYEKNTRKSSQIYRITLRMDDGSLLTIAQDNLPNFRIGNRVRVYNGAIVQ